MSRSQSIQGSTTDEEFSFCRREELPLPWTLGFLTLKNFDMYISLFNTLGVRKEQKKA